MLLVCLGRVRPPLSRVVLYQSVRRGGWSEGHMVRQGCAGLTQSCAQNLGVVRKGRRSTWAPGAGHRAPLPLPVPARQRTCLRSPRRSWRELRPPIDRAVRQGALCLPDLGPGCSQATWGFRGQPWPLSESSGFELRLDSDPACVSYFVTLLFFKSHSLGL